MAGVRRPDPSSHRPRKRFGQHFLAPEWAAKVVNAIAPGPDDHFLEIGPGRAAITRLLAARAAHVTAIEIDRDLAQWLREQELPRVSVIEQDVLTVGFEDLDLRPGTRVAGNLPYNISSPILFRLLDLAHHRGLLGDATLMLQKEVVDRIVAVPGSKDYGLLSIFVALSARVTRLLTLPPGAFRPPPKVTSAVVRLDFLAPHERPSVPPPFSGMVRSLFGARRKTIANGLKVPAGLAGTRPDAVLRRAGIDGSLRPEQLDVARLLTLAGALHELSVPDPLSASSEDG